MSADGPRTTAPANELRGLVALLESYVPADGVEAEHRSRMLELATSGDDAFSRFRFVPGHFTASAFVLSPDQESLLFVFHRRLNQWLQPGGHIDPGDRDVFQAASREVAEETGVRRLKTLDGKSDLFDLDVHGIPSNRMEPPHEHFDVRFLVRAEDSRLDLASEVREARWVKMTELDAIRPDQSIKRAVAKIERRLRGGGVS